MGYGLVGKDFIYQAGELLVSNGVAQFAERSGQAPVVPLMFRFVRYLKDLPQLVSFGLVVTPYSAHVA